MPDAMPVHKHLNKVCALIIGGGPAGCTAAIYLARAAIKCRILRTVSSPSQISYTEELDNYPGLEHVNGFDFVQRLETQVRDLGGEIDEAQVTNVSKGGEGFRVETAEGKSHTAAAVIMATGSRPRILGIPGEEKYRAKGVSYCGTCDGAFFKGKTVVVVGAGDTAAEDGYLLSRLAAKVYLVHRRDRMRAQAAFAERFLSQPNVEPVWNSVPVEITGESTVAGLRVRDVRSGEERLIRTDGVFIFVGGIPNTEMSRGLAPMDEQGYVVTDEEMRTEVPGLFAAGDCRKKTFRQVVTAAADGAIAAFSAQRYIETLEGCVYPGK